MSVLLSKHDGSQLSTTVTNGGDDPLTVGAYLGSRIGNYNPHSTGLAALC